MSPNTHFTDTWTLLISLFQHIWRATRFAPLDGVCKCPLKGWAASPYIQSISRCCPNEKCTNWPKILDVASINLSWRLPSVGPYKLVITPLGHTIDWNFMPCTRLCSLYSCLCSSAGLHTERTLPSTKPQKVSNGAPIWWCNWHVSSDLLETAKVG